MTERIELIQPALKERIAETGFTCNSCGNSFSSKKLHMVVSYPDAGGVPDVFFKCGSCVENDGNLSRGGDLHE